MAVIANRYQKISTRAPHRPEGDFTSQYGAYAQPLHAQVRHTHPQRSSILLNAPRLVVLPPEFEPASPDGTLYFLNSPMGVVLLALSS